jgi:hypothetical protein
LRNHHIENQRLIFVSSAPPPDVRNGFAFPKTLYLKLGYALPVYQQEKPSVCHANKRA